MRPLLGRALAREGTCARRDMPQLRRDARDDELHRDQLLEELQGCAAEDGREEEGEDVNYAGKDNRCYETSLGRTE